jgi:hypothetical protein
MRAVVTALGVVFALAPGGLAGCGGGAPKPPPGTPLTAEQLMDPASCTACHPDHVREWARSMHAYASDDPVFMAMNRRGQRETHGALGSFCIQCHAPLAFRSGTSSNGLNLASLPLPMKGVTCFFCHTADSVSDTHNAPVHLAGDGVMRGGIADPLPTAAHHASYSSLHDREQTDSAKICGSCHDIVTTLGAPIERTYQEWQRSLYAAAPIDLSCGKCHMDGRDAVAAQVQGAKTRKVHSHVFPAVDTALTPFPDPDLLQSEVQAILLSTLQASLCVEEVPGQRIYAVLDNVGAGHAWPSGATQDRRVWIEVRAYSGGTEIYRSGYVSSSSVAVEGLPDPDLWLVRDCMFDPNGRPVSMFWQAAEVKSNQLPTPLTTNKADPRYYQTHVDRRFPASGDLPALPDRVTMRVRLQPIGRAVLDDLVVSGDLDPSIRDKMPTLDVPGGALEWTENASSVAFTDRGTMLLCVTNGLTGPVATATLAATHADCSL